MERKLNCYYLEGAYLNKLGDEMSYLDMMSQNITHPNFKHYCNSYKDKNEEIVYYTYGSYEI